MFVGEHLHSLDAKGRVTMPSKFREALGETFMVSKGLDGALYAFPQAEWEKFSEKLATLPWTLKESRDFKRFFFSGATECEVDKMGRINLPTVLRQFAKLTKEVYIIGAYDRVEIWDKDRWEEHFAEEHFDPDLVAEKMSDLGIL